jgi:hypothetical protein
VTKTVDDFMETAPAAQSSDGQLPPGITDADEENIAATYQSKAKAICLSPAKDDAPSAPNYTRSSPERMTTLSEDAARMGMTYKHYIEYIERRDDPRRK